MSAFRRIDTLLDRKTSGKLASEIAARKREQAGHDRDRPDQPVKPDMRPLAARTRGSATQAIYGLVLALSVIAVSWYYGKPDAGRVALSVLLTAVVFWLAHVYAYVLGRDVSRKRKATRAEVAHALRENSSLIEVVIPVLLVLGLGELRVLSDTAAIVAATVIASAELGAAGGYAARRHGSSARGVIASAAVGLTLGLIVVVLKAFAFTH